MSTRISDIPNAIRKGAPLFVAVLLLLAACKGSKDEPIAGSTPIDCLMPGASGFKPVCSMEKMESPDGTVIVARAMDGGFRRLLIVPDGRGVVAADGAEPVAVKPAGAEHIDVTAGDVVYRLPARIAA